MDNVAKNFAQKIIAELEKIYHVLLNAPRQPEVAPSSPENTPEQEHDPTQRKVALSSNHNPPPRDTHQAKNPWYKTFKGWRTLLEMIAIPFAIGYAVVTWLQWRDLRRNFKIDQRAWLFVAENARPSLAVNIALPASINITNTGKTPGRHILADIYIEIVQNGSAPHLDSLRFGYIGHTGLLLPNSPITVPARRERHKINGGPHDALDDPLTQGELESLMRGDSWIAMHGIVRYRDIFQIEHWTKFCFWNNPLRAGDYSSGSCTAYNAVDDNE
jgi:hypothetical protein